MNEKQKRFIEEYLVDLNATRAYIRAGYTCNESAARRNSARLLTNADIKEAVAVERQKIAERSGISVVRVVSELATVALSDVRKAFHEDGRVKQPHELDDATAAAVASVEYAPDGGFKLKLWDKNSAADKLMKHLGAYEKDNQQSGAGIVDAVKLIISGVKPDDA